MVGEADRADERARMVETQIAARGVTDPLVLDAMRRVPRHLFVEGPEQARAYGDYPLSIGHGQTISQPFIVAYMTEALRPAPGKRVLEIGTGCGYQTAVLAETGAEVWSIEIEPGLAAEADERLSALGYDRVHLRTGDGTAGWPEAAPFDAVLVAAAPAGLPQSLVDQLAIGGRIVIPVGYGHQQLIVAERTETGLREEPRMAVRFVPLRTAP